MLTPPPTHSTSSPSGDSREIPCPNRGEREDGDQFLFEREDGDQFLFERGEGGTGDVLSFELRDSGETFVLDSLILLA